MAKAKGGAKSIIALEGSGLPDGRVLLVRLKDGRFYRISGEQLEAFRDKRLEGDRAFQKRVNALDGTPGLDRACYLIVQSLLDGG
jgi:hypothetical protein